MYVVTVTVARLMERTISAYMYYNICICVSVYVCNIYMYNMSVVTVTVARLMERTISAYMYSICICVRVCVCIYTCIICILSQLLLRG
jgi:hypothetical protein